MKWFLTHRAWRDYQGAPASVKKAFDKQVHLLAENLRHPSLRAKKYDEANDIWQAENQSELAILFSNPERHLHHAGDSIFKSRATSTPSSRSFHTRNDMTLNRTH